MTLRLIPPVAVPVGLGQLASSALGGVADVERFAADLGERLRLRQAVLFGSGRAALAAYLERVRRPGRDEVVVPAYTCWSVPAAVVRAGLRVRVVDVDPASFDLVPQEVACAVGEKTSAVVGAHLFAPSCDLVRLAALVRDRDETVRVVEDAAQAWPRSRPSPADAVVLSFGRGKPLALGGGGALLLRGDGDGVDVSRTGAGGRLGALSLALTSLLAQPAWYRLPESLPFLRIGVTEYDPGFRDDLCFRGWQGRLGRRLLGGLEELVQARSRNAQHLCRRIERLPRTTLPAPAFEDGPLRLPLLASTRTARDAMLLALRRRGVAASPMYPGTLLDIPALRAHVVNPDADVPGARALADRLLTLPTYPGLRERDLEAIAAGYEATLAEVA